MQLDAPKPGKKHFNPPYFYFAEKLKKLQPLGKMTFLCLLAIKMDSKKGAE